MARQDIAPGTLVARGQTVRLALWGARADPPPPPVPTGVTPPTGGGGAAGLSVAGNWRLVSYVHNGEKTTPKQQGVVVELRPGGHLQARESAGRWTHDRAASRLTIGDDKITIRMKVLRLAAKEMTVQVEGEIFNLKDVVVNLIRVDGVPAVAAASGPKPRRWKKLDCGEAIRAGLHSGPRSSRDPLVVEGEAGLVTAYWTASRSKSPETNEIAPVGR